MRFFPSASRQRVAATTAVAAIVLAAAAIPLAQAEDDDLKDRRDQVQQQIKQAQGELEHASRAARRATARAASAVARLESAQAHLAAVRRQVAAARVRDAQMQRALAVAEARLVTAREELAEGRAAAIAQRDKVAETVVTMYEQGNPDLQAIMSFVNVDSLEDLELQADASRTIRTNEHDLYADLKLAEQRLKEQERAVELAEAEAERQRVAAAEHLATMRTLEQEAATAAAGVRDLVARSRTARQAAVAARAADRSALARLKEREERIKQQILEAAHAEGNTFNGATNGFLNYPVNGPVTSPFGYRRHPIYGYWGLHDGTDFGAGCGQPLFASAQGTVVETYYDEVYGNRLYLNVGRVNGANLTLVYNHMSGYRVGEGARVGRGDVVGFVGSTGWSTGCHLHFTVLRNGNPVDPMNYM